MQARVHQLDCIGEFLLAQVKNRLFVKLYSRYTDYFTEYLNYFGRALILLNSMYGMTNSGKLFADYLTEWLLEAGFIQSQCHMSIYYKYALDGSKQIFLSYVDGCVYWYTYEALRKLFVDTLGKIFHLELLVYAHWFMSIIISHMKDHSISIDQARYATYIVAKYLDTVTVNTSTNFYNVALPYDILFTKYDTSTSDEQVEKLTQEFNIHYRACIGSLTYLLYTRVDLIFAVQKLEKFSEKPGK